MNERLIHDCLSLCTVIPVSFWLYCVTYRIGCTFSCWALRFEFQQNSKMATTMAIASPHSRTTNTPPIVLPFDDLVVGGRWSVGEYRISHVLKKGRRRPVDAVGRTGCGQSVNRQFKSRQHKERKRERERE